MVLKASKKLKGGILALIATFLWASNIIVARNISDSFPPMGMAFLRWLVAAIVFTPFALKKAISEWSIIKKQIPYLLRTSITGITFFNVSFYIAAQTTTAINLSLISISFPVFIIIISRIYFKERITLKGFSGVIVIIMGVLILLFKGSPENLFNIKLSEGDVWMLLASILFAIYSIMIQRKPDNLKMIPFQYFSFLMGLGFLAPFYLIEVYSGKVGTFNTSSILSIVYSGVFASLAALIVWSKSITFIGSVQAGIYYYMLPIFSAFLAIIFLNEKLSFFHLESVTMIMIGIFLSKR